MQSINIHDAKTHLSRLVDEVQSGRVEALIIARAGKPVARLVPMQLRQVRLGLAAGKYAIPDPDAPEFLEIERGVAADFDVKQDASDPGIL